MLTVKRYLMGGCGGALKALLTEGLGQGKSEFGRVNDKTDPRTVSASKQHLPQSQVASLRQRTEL